MNTSDPASEVRVTESLISRKALLDEDIPTGDYRFNVLNHVLVPHHELVPIEDEAQILEPWGLRTDDAFGKDRLAKELLPKILITDPRSRSLRRLKSPRMMSTCRMACK